MKAIRVSEYGGPAVLKLEEIPTPQPGPNQVLVRNHAVGINPVDTYLRSNTDNRGPKLPYTPGGDAAGVIEAVGSGVTAVKKGDRVYVGGTATGAYAEYAVCEQGQVHPLAAGATLRAGRGHERALRDRVPRALQPRARRGGRDGAGPRGERRRRDRRGAARAGARPHRHRHREHREGAAPGRGAGRAPRARPQRAGLPRGVRQAHRRARARHHHGDAGERESPEGPGRRSRCGAASWSSATAATPRSTRASP